MINNTLHKELKTKVANSLSQYSRNLELHTIFSKICTEKLTEALQLNSVDNQNSQSKFTIVIAA